MTYLSRQELEEQLQNKIIENNNLLTEKNQYILTISELQNVINSLTLELGELRIKSNNSDQVRDYIYEHNYHDIINLIETIVL